jgi:hypothetical protein
VTLDDQPVRDTDDLMALLSEGVGKSVPAHVIVAFLRQALGSRIGVDAARIRAA